MGQTHASPVQSPSQDVVPSKIPVGGDGHGLLADRHPQQKHGAPLPSTIAFLTYGEGFIVLPSQFDLVCTYASKRGTLDR